MALAFMAAAPPAGAADSVTIGFITTFLGPWAIIGKHRRGGCERDVVRGADGKPCIRDTDVVFAGDEDSYCKHRKMKY